MDSKYMKRAKRLVCLSLGNDCDNRLSTTEMKYVFAEGNQTNDLIRPDDLGFSLIPPQSSVLDHVEDEIFEDYGQKIFVNPHVAIPVSDFNEDVYYIENSQDCNYAELNCNSKRLKLDTSSESLKENLSSNYVLNKPKVTVPETPCNSESDSEPDYMRSDNIIGAIQNNDVDSVFPDPPVIYNSQLETTPTTSSLKISNKKQQRKEVLKFPNYSKEERKLRSKEKHSMLPEDCGFKCRKKCEYFNLQRRCEIWNSYWNLNHDSQIKWISRYVHLKPVMVKRIEKKGETFRKSESRSFFLPCRGGEMKQVCKKMFLNTFGYKNDSIITTVSKKLKEDTTKSLTDKRGTHEKPKIDTSIIEHFINLYKPCVAHYRRHNSPNMRYLGQDVTLETLFKEFKQQYPEFKCCKEIIRRTLKQMNISLHRPKGDKCYDCLSYETSIAGYAAGNQVPSLKLLCQKTIHNQKAKEAIDAYSIDASRNKILGEKIYSMDLQKSVLLPMMPEVKDCFFTNRMIVFNLTFCGLSKSEQSKCIIWHEADGGRDGRDIVDAIYTFILNERDVKHLVLWADNCCAQNKNWILYTALITLMNTNQDRESITIKYLTKGHTHMSADGVHGNIEKRFKKVKNIYDFTDYKECLRASRKGNEVIQVVPVEKRIWEKKKKIKMESIMLADLVEVKFLKNKRIMLYKKSFADHYHELDFLQKRYKPDQLPKLITRVRGISTAKKAEILKKLVPLMPSNRRAFWQDLPENESSVDLITGGQFDQC